MFQELSAWVFWVASSIGLLYGTIWFVLNTREQLRNLERRHEYLQEELKRRPTYEASLP